MIRPDPLRAIHEGTTFAAMALLPCLLIGVPVVVAIVALIVRMM